MGLLVFFLGILGLLYWWPVFLGFAGLVACGLGYAKHVIAGELLKPGSAPRNGVLKVTGALLLVFCLGPVLYAALYPPTSIDALSYHLPAAKAYLQHHQVLPVPNLRFPVLPALGEMLFAGAMLLFDDVTAQLIEFLFLILILATLISWAQHLKRPLAGLWSVGLLVGTPSLMLIASTAYVDVGEAAFATLGFYAVYRYGDTRERAWLGLAGAFGGCAAGTKHSGLLLLILLAAWALAEAWTNRTRLRRLWPFPVAALAFGGPWYLWIGYWTGNPVWPFLGRFFGYGFWTKSDLALLEWSLQYYGWGRSLRSFLLLPWHLMFSVPVGELPLQPVPFALLPLTIWLAFRKRESRGLLLTIAAYVVVWFFTSQQVRFLLPVLPVLAFVDSWALDELTADLRRSAPLWARRVAAVVLFLCFSYPLLGLYHLAPLYGPLPTNAPARDEYLRQRIPSYAIYRELNLRYGKDYTIYSLHDDATRYYCDGTQFGDWYGAGRYGDFPLDSATRLFEWLRKSKVDFLLVKSEPSAAALAAAPESQRFFESIPTNSDVRLFRLKGKQD